MTGQPDDRGPLPDDALGSNPFRTPAPIDGAIDWTSASPEQNPDGYVRQVRVVAVLLIVHGTLLLALAVVLLLMTVALAFVPTSASDPEMPLNPEMKFWVSAAYAAVAGVLLAIALVQIFAGIRNLWLRGRTLGLFALGLGVLAALTVYCAPTAIALAIFGLIVYLHPSVELAFRLRAQGLSYQEVYRHFGRP